MIHDLEKIKEEIIEIRRHLHKNPELSFHEEKTPAFIYDYLKKLGNFDIRKNVGGRGVVAELKGKNDGKTVALRADFDALPIQDEKDVSYKSEIDGVMHACGHDAHTASLLGVAKVLSQNTKKFDGKVRFIFQHAEEVSPGGAIAMIEDGCLDGVDAIFGNHMSSEKEVGITLYGYGEIMANADMFQIIIQGKGGHGAYPHNSIDPIVLSANIITNFQQIVSRRTSSIEPCVLSVCKINSGTASNIIPDTAEIAGTVRTYNKNVQDKIITEMEKIIKGICESAGANYTFKYEKGYPAVINTKDETDLVKEVMNTLGFESEEMKPRMGGEDFSYYLQKVPGSFFYTGSGNKKKGITYPHHHPKFDVDENSIINAAKVLLTSALEYLKK
ncbi:MAG: amidohydrolase [Defluviitaleaceae bacterium]|nr:amidohydrolase [Defluviitaleaceae bacterium]